MRDIFGLEGDVVAGVNGVVYKKQTMLTERTVDVDFKSEVRIDGYFQNIYNQFIGSNVRCLVQIFLRYSWESDICPDFRIVVSAGGVELSSKKGLDDYPLSINEADYSCVVNDVTSMRIKLTKTDIDISRFKLHVNSFIKIEVL